MFSYKSIFFLLYLTLKFEHISCTLFIVGQNISLVKMGSVVWSL